MTTLAFLPPLPDVDARPQRPLLAVVLSLVLLLFLVSAVASLLDNSLFLLLHRQDTSAVNELLGSLMMLAGLATCGLVAFFPAIPKRHFVPIGLFLPVATVAALPFLVYFHAQAHVLTWFLSLGQLALGLAILRRAQGRWGFSWPLYPSAQLADRSFRWGNFVSVMFTGAFIVLPAFLLYLACTAKLAVHHFTDGFVTLRPSGISMEVRKYTRDDGRKITLVPMSHIGEPEFYRALSASFPADAVVLMEGVTDDRKLMGGHLDYSRIAAVAGGVLQTTAFKPPGEIVAADVDVSSFSSTTLDLLRTAMLVHAKGVTPETLPLLMKPTSPELEAQLMTDLLTNRNQHLLEVIQERLLKSEDLIVPWGAAHMPGISREIQKAGFHLIESREYLAIRFGS